MISPLQEQGELIGYVPEPLDVGNVPAGLYGELEIGRRTVPPALKRLRGRQPVERVVELHR